VNRFDIQIENGDQLVPAGHACHDLDVRLGNVKYLGKINDQLIVRLVITGGAARWIFTVPSLSTSAILLLLERGVHVADRVAEPFFPSCK